MRIAIFCAAAAFLVSGTASPSLVAQVRLPEGTQRIPWPPDVPGQSGDSKTSEKPAGEKPAVKVQRLIAQLKAQLGKPKAESTDPEPFYAAEEAMSELAELGPAASDAVPVLMQALTRPGDPEDLRSLRMNAGFALGHMGEKAVKPSIEALSHDEREVRFYAVQALGLNGAKARPAIPHLLQMLEDADENLRGNLAESLGRIGDERGEVAAALVKLLDDQESSVRASAVQGLGHLGGPAKPAVPALIKLLKDEGQESYVRGHAATALGKIGPVTEEVIPALIETLQTEDAHVRGVAAYALYLIGAEAEAAIPALTKVLKEPRPVPEGLSGEAEWGTRLFNTIARSNAAFALGRIGKEGTSVLKEVAENDPDREVRESAAMSLRIHQKEQQEE